MPRTRAFTLIELLVTMAIIAVIAALLLTAIGHAKASAQAVACRSNLKQWGLATLLFAANHDDSLPLNGSSSGNSPTNGWYIELPEDMNLPPYNQMPWRTNPAIDPGNSIWICPSNTRRSNSNNLFHYCLNENISGTSRARLSSIGRPTVAVWLFDNGGLAPVAKQNNVHPNLHNHGAQFVFLDAHVARFQNTEYWDFKHDKGLTNNPELVWTP